MKKVFVLLFFISFCSGVESNDQQQNTSTIVSNQFGKFIPVSCEGDGVGCEKLYMENANTGWRDVENKYCDVSFIKFVFEEEFKIDFITITNFQDDKFKKSAKPKSVSIFGPLVEGMQYGGYVERAFLSETKEEQYILFYDEWPPVDELLLEIQNGHFTPTKVQYCGIQNIEFFGYYVEKSK